MKFIGIIPARYASTRFPAKPLAMLGGKRVIERVYAQVKGQLDDVWVATDDERIEQAVRDFGGQVVMTSTECRSGTDRCWEAASKLQLADDDVVVNIQGDEPFIQPRQIDAIKACFDEPSVDIATLVKPFVPADGFAALENVNSPKVVVNRNMEALYFSRFTTLPRRQACSATPSFRRCCAPHVSVARRMSARLRSAAAFPWRPAFPWNKPI